MSETLLHLDVQVTTRDAGVAVAAIFLGFFIGVIAGYNDGLKDAGVTRQVTVTYPLAETTPDEMCQDLGYDGGYSSGPSVESDDLFELHCTDNWENYTILRYPGDFGPNMTVTEHSGGDTAQ